jgi:hypothetical protein
MELSLLEDLMVMLVLLEEKLLWILTVDGEDMVEVLFQAKTAPRLIDLGLMQPDKLLFH